MTSVPNRFSQLYLERKGVTRDSERFRHRLSAFFSERVHERYNFLCRQLFERETGKEVPFRGQSWYFPDVFKQLEMRDVLDAITVTHTVLLQSNAAGLAREWLSFVARAMREEAVGYRVDADCVVHFHVDEEFERNRVATLSILEHPSFGAVRAAFEDAYWHLDASPQDTKAAVRSMFESVEIIAKVIDPKAERLTKNLCNQSLKDRVRHQRPSTRPKSRRSAVCATALVFG